MTQASELYALQKIDITWEKVRRRLAQIKQLLGETEEVRTARQRVADTEAALHLWHGHQKDAELEGQSLKSRIADTEKRLMSGAVRNPKELESLEASLEALRRHYAAVEDKGVEALLQVEETTATLATHKAELERVESAWRAGQDHLLEEEHKLKRNFVILKKQRETAVAALGAAAMQRYDYLRERKAGVAVAAIDRGTCGACHVQLPTGVVSAARSSAGDLVTCPSCGRILYAGG